MSFETPGASKGPLDKAAAEAMMLLWERDPETMQRLREVMNHQLDSSLTPEEQTAVAAQLFAGALISLSDAYQKATSRATPDFHPDPDAEADRLLQESPFPDVVPELVRQVYGLPDTQQRFEGEQ